MSVALHLLLAWLISFGGAVGTIYTTVWLRSHKYVSPLVSRKFMHIATGPVFVLLWLLFPYTSRIDPSYDVIRAGTSPADEWVGWSPHAVSIWARYLSASIPLASTTYFVLNGLGLLRHSSLVNTVSRSGQPRELVKGPLMYGIVHVAGASWYWTDRPTGMVAMITLCVGDGFADLVGRAYGSRFGGSLPWSRSKSWAGSIAFFVLSLVTCAVYGVLFIWLGYFQPLTVYWYLTCLPIIILVSTFVESLPIAEYDNITVFAAAVLVGQLLWP